MRNPNTLLLLRAFVISCSGCAMKDGRWSFDPSTIVEAYLYSCADPELDQPWRDREGPFAPICRTVHNTSWARSFEADYGRLNWRGCSAVPGFARHPPFCSCEQVCTPKRCSLGMSVFDRSVRIATAGRLRGSRPARRAIIDPPRLGVIVVKKRMVCRFST
jgi:hypothetical protein